MLEWVSEVFWHERLWFPEGLGWADLEDRDGRVFAKARDLWAVLPIAVLFLVIRQVFERSVTDYNYIYFVMYRVFALQRSVEKLCKQTGWTEPQVQRWFRRRRNQDRPNLLKKFREASWRFAFYLLAFIGGLVALIDKPWLYDLEEMWKGFPTLTLLPSQYWYYMLELGFYTSLLFSVASDVKRKVSLPSSHCRPHLCISVNQTLFFEHLSPSYHLSLSQSAKMFNYARWKNACNYIFILFAVIFIVTRLIIFPFRIMYCTWVYPVTLYPPFFVYYFFNGLLMVLLCLHIFWAVLIIRLAFRFLSSNSSVEDERSDREETDESEEEEQMKNGEIQKNGPAQNGHATYNNNHSKKTE
uniref:Ceramide synthase 2b n=1 Tax=Sinocyclocheilus rhinocerous TaxID=307959 RepID=A0A673JRB0_9TELE